MAVLSHDQADAADTAAVIRTHEAMTSDGVSAQFDFDERMQHARQALTDAAASAANPGPVPPDLAPGGWRWQVLADLDALGTAVGKDYVKANARQRKQAWESRFGGPVTTGGGAAIGAVMSAVGAGLVKTSTVAGWVILVLGVIFAFFGSIFTATSYVQNRNKKLRFLRLLHDIADYACLVLPTAQPGDVFGPLDNLRQLWETAGS